MSEVGNLLLAQVALLSDLPERGLIRGQVGTVVETLDEKTVLVEFIDEDGRGYAVSPRASEALLPLKMSPLAA